MNELECVPMRMRWARLRFQIIGQLLAAPPGHGELSIAIEELAKKQAKATPVDTMESLARTVRGDAGKLRLHGRGPVAEKSVSSGLPAE